MSTSKIKSIQALRAAAVIPVVYIHSFISNQNSFQYHFFHLYQWGAIGVDLFFVISGFIMTTIMPTYLGGRLDAKNFIVKRFIRIFPLYWLISFIVILISLKNYAISTESLIKTVAFFPLIDRDHFIFPIIPPGWTLPYEVFFFI